MLTKLLDLGATLAMMILALGVAAYAQWGAARYARSSARTVLLSVSQIALGVALGWLAVRYSSTEGISAAFAFVLAFSLAHLPGALVVLVRHGLGWLRG